MEREGRGERRNKEREGTVEGKRERERGLRIIQEKKEGEKGSKRETKGEDTWREKEEEDEKKNV